MRKCCIFFLGVRNTLNMEEQSKIHYWELSLSPLGTGVMEIISLKFD